MSRKSCTTVFTSPWPINLRADWLVFKFSLFLPINVISKLLSTNSFAIATPISDVPPNINACFLIYSTFRIDMIQNDFLIYNYF